MRILGHVVPAASIEHHIIKFVQHRRETARSGRHIEREGPTWRRKAQRRWVRCAKALEHRHEAGGARRGEALDHTTQRVLFAHGHQHLVLHEAARTICLVPSADHVERMEVLRNCLQFAHAVQRRLAEPCCVERLHRHPIQRADRNNRRYRYQHRGRVFERWAIVVSAELFTRGVLAARQNAATEMTPRGHQIDPRHRVAIAIIAFLHQRHHVIKVVRSRGVDNALAGLDRDHVDRDIEDHTREPHAADRCPEQVGAESRAQLGDAAVGEQHRDATHVVTERAFEVMVLAVDIAGYCTANGDETRARRNRHEETLRHKHPQQIVDAHASANSDLAFRNVEQRGACVARKA